MFLKGIDLLIALLNGIRVDKFTDLYDQHIFIMRTVKDGDVAFLGADLMDTPEVIMGQLCFCRRLKGGNMQV